MNNFTKEELETIVYLIDFYCVNSWPPEGVYASLKSKIQSLIENYCDHQWVCWDDVNNNRKCMSCGEERQGAISDE